ncbi:MAG: hypothetical protein NZ571_06510 [Anaerolineae bacterium]|nr:hypothetical protein [Anaerolineae bacterium]
MSKSGASIPDEALPLDIRGCVRVGDTPNFSLTWALLSDFLAQLGAQWLKPERLA